MTFTNFIFPGPLQELLVKTKITNDTVNSTYFIYFNLFVSVYRYGIEVSDIFRSVSDTTNSAVAAGSIISEGRSGRGGGTTCVMHTQELCLKHALGVCVQKQKGVLVDSFVEGNSLHDRVKLFAFKLMDKKLKGRFAEYNRVCLENYRTPALKIALPNDTQVSGTFFFFLTFLEQEV